MELRASAEALQAAVTSLLYSRDEQHQNAANEWINAFLGEPHMWTVALYVAFPHADHGTVGATPETRFFVLNLLLSKLRSDWLQLAQADADEIFEALLRQLPVSISDRTVSSRLCVVLSAAAGVAGAHACNQLVSYIVEGLDKSEKSALVLSLELLTALADETLHRGRALPWEIEQCMQSFFPRVLNFLQSLTVATSDGELQASSFICLERWIQAGITLSEVYTDYPALFNALLNSIGSPDESCAVAGCSTLSEMVSSVDLLPGRDAAVRSVISAVLKFKGYFNAANRKRSHALCVLITAIGCAESALISKGGAEELLLLDWLVEATSGGGGLGLEGATVAAEVWPRLAARTSGHISRGQVFLAAAKAVLNVVTYPPSDHDEVDDEFYVFRDGMAQDVLAAAFKELGSSFLSLILEKLLQSCAWNEAEVCLYAIWSLSQQISAIVNQNSPANFEAQFQEFEAVRTFLLKMFRGDTGPTILETVSGKWPCGKLVETAVRTIEGQAKWIASEPAALEKSVNYTLTALTIPDAKAAAAETLRELCRASAPHLAAARAVSLLMGACEQAIATTLGGMQSSESINLIGGLAAVAAALPPGEAEATISCLAASAVATIKDLSPLQMKSVDYSRSLASALKLITTILEFAAGGSQLHPAIPVMEEVWGALDVLACNCSSDVVIASALCELWGMLAAKIGIMMQNVLPRVITTVADMFKQHLVAPCIDCLSSIAPLASSSDEARKELELCMTAALGGITEAMGSLEVLSRAQEPQSFALESLGAICRLGRACLRYIPSFMASGSFAAIFTCALGLLQLGDRESAVSAGTFLSEAIYGGSLEEEWRVPSEARPLLDNVSCLSVVPLVETVLRLLAHGQVTVGFKETLIDVLYSLVVRHPAATQSAMVAFLNSPKFYARPGVLNEASKRHFVIAATRHPVRSRRIFQEMGSDFSRVCQALSPAEVLFDY